MAEDGDDEGDDDPEKGKGKVKGKKGEMEKRLTEEIKKREASDAKIAKFEEETEIRKIMDEDLKDVKGVAVMDTLAKAVHTLRKSDEGSTDTLVSVIKSLTAQLKKNNILIKQIGGDGSGEADPIAKLDTIAKALAKSEGISYKAAYAKMLDSDPEAAKLYEESQKNQPTE